MQSLNMTSSFKGKFRKAQTYQHNSVMDAVMLSVENLEPGLKAKYKQLAIFLDDVVIPTKVSSQSNWHRV